MSTKALTLEGFIDSIGADVNTPVRLGHLIAMRQLGVDLTTPEPADVSHVNEADIHPGNPHHRSTTPAGNTSSTGAGPSTGAAAAEATTGTPRASSRSTSKKGRK